LVERRRLDSIAALYRAAKAIVALTVKEILDEEIARKLV
jgi:hypothetical protein